MATRTPPEKAAQARSQEGAALGPKRRLRPLSPTALKSFAECPKRFHYSYVAQDRGRRCPVAGPGHGKRPASGPWPSSIAYPRISVIRSSLSEPFVTSGHEKRV